MLHYYIWQDSLQANSSANEPAAEDEEVADTPVGRKPGNQQPVDYTIFVSAPKEEKDGPTNDSINPNQVRYAWGKDEQQLQ